MNFVIKQRKTDKTTQETKKLKKKTIRVSSESSRKMRGSKQQKKDINRREANLIGRRSSQQKRMQDMDLQFADYDNKASLTIDNPFGPWIMTDKEQIEKKLMKAQSLKTQKSPSKKKISKPSHRILISFKDIKAQQQIKRIKSFEPFIRQKTQSQEKTSIGLQNIRNISQVNSQKIRQLTQTSREKKVRKKSAKLIPYVYNYCQNNYQSGAMMNYINKIVNIQNIKLNSCQNIKYSAIKCLRIKTDRRQK